MTPRHLVPALFLDRDGIINLDLGYVHRIEDFIFRDGIFELCAAAQTRGLALVVVTNQAGIGRGYFTEADFHLLTEWMIGQFATRFIAITGVEFCPDHPTHGVGAYRRDSPRRKPAPGMIVDAAAAHGLDLAGSALIGDRATDMLAGRAAGVGRLLLVPADDAEAQAAPPGTTIIEAGGLVGAIPHLP
jgi:D-glycero-D-manno-heptose 1,7-bisphosphate phosphatase